MIIGISGSQGQGKSTLITAAIESGGGETRSSLFLDGHLQTARDILKKWNYSLSEVNKYLPLKIRYQEQLLSDHRNSLRIIRNSGRTYLVERTFADIFVYALVSVGAFNEYSDWLNNYAEECMAAQQSLLDWSVYLSGRKYIPEEDSVRSTNPYFSSMIDILIKKYTEEFSMDKGVEISVEDLDERVKALLHLTTRK